MLRLLFPRVIDNRFRGQWPGFWLLAPALVLKFGVALGSMITPANASRADAIDLTSYSAAALRDAMATTALLGLLHFAIGLMALLAMVRYRAMVPLVYLWLILELLGRRLLLGFYPIDRAGGPSGGHPGGPSGGLSSGAILNLVLVSTLVLGFALSLWPRRAAPPAA